MIFRFATLLLCAKHHDKGFTLVPFRPSYNSRGIPRFPIKEFLVQRGKAICPKEHS